jgi:hypothetical protein
VAGYARSDRLLTQGLVVRVLPKSFLRNDLSPHY